MQQKFVTASFRFILFSYFVIFGIAAATHESWFWNPKEWFFGWPQFDISEIQKQYYCASFAHFLFETITLFIEPKQKDFYQMLGHHVVTMSLIWCSYGWGIHRYDIISLFFVVALFFFSTLFLIDNSSIHAIQSRHGRFTPPRRLGSYDGARQDSTVHG